jgi:hypothetical protein
MPMPRRTKVARLLTFGGIAALFIGVLLPPVLVLSLFSLMVGLVMMLVNLKHDMRWYREFKAARARAVGDLGY